MNLTELIAIHKSGRSYEQLAKDCGGVLTSQRLQQIATTSLKSFPAPATMRGLAGGLRVSETVVVLAVAESLGLDVGRALPRLVELLPASASSISDRQAAAIAEVIRAFTDREGGGEHEQRSAPIVEQPAPQPVEPQPAARGLERPSASQELERQLRANLERATTPGERNRIQAVLDTLAESSQGLPEDVEQSAPGSA